MFALNIGEIVSIQLNFNSNTCIVDVLSGSRQVHCRSIKIAILDLATEIDHPLIHVVHLLRIMCPEFSQNDNLLDLIPAGPTVCKENFIV